MKKKELAKILIIDDNPDDLMIFSRYLQDAGFLARCAGNLRESLEILSKESFECILVDYQMPKQEGIEAVKTLKTDPLFKFIPVIILTGLESEESAIEGLNRGADDFLNKSSSFKMILARIKAAIRVKRLYDEAIAAAKTNTNTILEPEKTI